MDTSVLALVAAVATIGELLVNFFITPIWEKYNWDRFWLKYVAWAVCGGLVALTGANLFPDYFTSPVVGFIVTAIIAGRGSNLLYDIGDKTSDE
jgi:ABC-type Mn2+/Zn2+ transport system permease subunit